MGDGPVPAAGGPQATVWTKENEYSSQGRTMVVPLEGLPPGAKTLCGEYVCVDERNVEGNKLTCSPAGGNDGPKSRCFTQKFAYFTLDRFFRFLNSDVGFDMGQIRASLRRYARALPVHVNEPLLDNAFYFPPDEELILGDGEGRFSLARDGDILVHEAVHWVLSVINPTLGEGFLAFGAAIHEGTADAVTALFFGDPQLGEAFNKFKNGAGYPGGIRSAHNTRTFQNTGDIDSHELGKIISGYWWSLFERIHALLRQQNAADAARNPALSVELARRATIKIALFNAGSYRLPGPGPAEFIEATATAVQDLAQLGELEELTRHNVGVPSLVAMVRQEGAARGFGWIQEKMAPDPLSATPANLAFGAPVMLMGTGGAAFSYHPQIYRSAHGPVLVAGYGRVERQGAAGMVGAPAAKLRKVDAGTIDETVAIDQAKAWQTAVAAIERDLGNVLAARTGDAAILPSTRMRIMHRARAVMTAPCAGKGRLALLPRQKNLVWLFDAGPVHVAVDAKSGTTKFILKAMVD